MVELDPTAEISLRDYVGITHFIGELVPVKVDVSERKALQTHVRPPAEREAVMPSDMDRQAWDEIASNAALAS